jgi:hypothetical protein
MALAPARQLPGAAQGLAVEARHALYAEQPLSAMLCPILPTQRIPRSFSMTLGKKHGPGVFFTVQIWTRPIERTGVTVGTYSKQIMHSAALCMALSLLLGLSACGGPGAGTVTSVTISPTTASVPLNQQTQFIASVTVAGLATTTTTTNTTTTNTVVTWQVNGVSGGNATTGTIVQAVNDPDEGIYTAPPKVPSTNSGQVMITAIAQRNPSNTAANGANTSVTSNIATLTISPGLGLQIISPPATVPAAGSAQFNATLNGLPDPNATWTVSSATGGNIGSINANSGVYSAPDFPPPSDIVTVTATDSTSGTTVTATTTVSITYSGPTLNGSFAFSYTGNDNSGFLAAAGSFVSNGAGGIVGGIEDISSFARGVTQAQILSTSTYIVNSDGRGTISLNTSQGTQTLAFVLTTNQHAIITRFDSSATGSGSMEQQSLTALGGSVSEVSGPYVFSALGTDASTSFNPEGIAGEFSANGGTISAANSVLDIHDGTTVTTATSLTADSSYAFDASSGTGRGTMTLNTPSGPLQFAFYIVDSTELYMVEIDATHSYLAGTMFSAVTGAPGLAAANYALTTGGAASATVGYAAGGIFVSGGSGTVSGGAFDTHSGATVAANATIQSCPYTVSSPSGRIDLKIFTGTGACPSGSATGLSEFAMYPYQTDLTDQPQTGFLILEVDSTAVSTGAAFQQTSATALGGGGFALGLAGQGLTHGTRAASAQDVSGQFSTVAGSTGNLDVNFFQPRSGDPLTGVTLSAPGTTGRGTGLITASNPSVSYNLVYYIVSANEALVLDQDTNATLVLTGFIERQF